MSGESLQQYHYSTVELANSRLTLRNDLTFHLQEYGNEPCYLIEDELNSRFFRIGVAEYCFVSMLDGSTTVGDAVARTANELGAKAISEQDAITLCKWLIESNLATTSASSSSDRLYESFAESKKRKTLASANPVTPKFKLLNPDRMLGAINRAFGWLLSVPVFFVWMVVVACAVYHVWSQWDHATGASSQVFAAGNWMWLTISWLALKLIHETAHGVACKRFGGDVRSAGVVLIVLIPLPFVDVTSSWRFNSKWQRIFVAAAGMYAEVFIASIAALVWAWADPGVLKTQAFNIVLAGSVTTLFFNANPLMRFDGYYMLTDWLELPNLATRGQQYLKWAGKKYYLGMEARSPVNPEGSTKTIVAYAILAFIWRIVICAGLIILAESILFGLGAVLAIAALALWVLWPVIKLFKFVFIGNETSQRPSAIRFCLLTSLLVSGGWSFATFAPWHARISAPAIVDYSELVVLRTPVGGFVREIHVKPDQHVEEGDLIARLENVELESEIQRVRIEIETAQLKARINKQEDNIPQWQIELNSLEALQKRLTELSGHWSQLELRSTISGQVIAEDLENLKDLYVAPGQMICSIGKEGSKEVHALVSQMDFERFSSREGEEVDVHLTGQGIGHFEATLLRVNPGAKLQLPHPAFSSTNGGPLPVRYRTTDESFDSAERQLAYELVNPRFLATVSLGNAESADLRAGQPGFISFRTTRGTVGDVLAHSLSNWLQKMRDKMRKD
ncbi:MAG: biotin/lipoyl-binding protein [Planctomycetota bacterium]